MGVIRMESNRSPSVLQFALEEERRLVSVLRSNPDFQQLMQVRRVIALWRQTDEPPAGRDQIITSNLSEHAIPDDRVYGPQPPKFNSLWDPAAPVRAARPRRGRWTWRRSVTAEIRREAEAYLRQKGQRAHGKEIWSALAFKGLRNQQQKTVGYRLRTPQ
jgi:hypothetical protein